MGKPKRIALMWYCKTPRGWLRFPAIIDKEHGRDVARTGWVMERGELTHYPEGRWQLRSWNDGKLVHTNLPEQVKHGADAARFRERELHKAKQAAGEIRRSLTMKDGMRAYILDLQRRHVLEAAEQARVVLEEFDEVCGSMFVKMVTRDCIFRYHAKLRKRGLSERTIANKHNRVRAFLRFHKIDVAFMPPVPRYEKKLPTIYTPGEISILRSAADEYMGLVIDMALMLGLRDQELVYASWSDVDFHHSVFRVQGKPALGFAVKDSEQRDVPIPTDLLSRLAEWKVAHPDTSLILGTRTDEPNGHLLRSLKRLAQGAGLNCGQCKSCLKHVPPVTGQKIIKRQADPTTGQECQRWQLHKFRRTYLTTLLRSGVDAKTVQHFAGHADLKTTLQYLSPAGADEMQAKINTIQWGSPGPESKPLKKPRRSAARG
jgi:integrase